MGQPIAGAIADRFGVLRVVCVGALLYAAGLLMMRYAATPLSLDLGAGVLIGFGLSGCSFNLVLSAFSKLLPPERRGIALGAGTAAGSFGQFLFAPFGVALIDNFGWQSALMVFAALMLLIVPLSLALATPPAAPTNVPAADQQSFKTALAEAFGHRSYVLLVLGFFTCGFQLAFITVHLPAYLVDRGICASTGGWVIAAIGLFNIMGSLGVGWLQNLFPKRYILSVIYFTRALSIIAFISFPITTFSAIAFGAISGLTWLSTVPPTSALVALMFGTRWFATLYGFAFVSHQVGGFLGVWLGGVVFERFRVVHADLVAFGPVRRAVGADQPADRRGAGYAPGCAAGLTVQSRALATTNRGEAALGTFKAIRIDKAEKGTTAALTQFDEAELMDGDVTVRVEWSTLNYKDGLAVTGKAPVVRRFPMIAGIDFAGTVEQSSHPQWKAGDQVICNGWGMGETHLGSYAEKARVKGDWLVRLPAGMSAREAMAIGTAGYTAMLAVLALEQHGLSPGARSRRGHRRRRRCRLGCDRGAVEARLPRHRVDRPPVGGRLSQGSRCSRSDRSQRTRGTGQAAGQRALGGRGRQRRLDHAGQPFVDDEIPRRHRRVRACRRHGPAVLGGAVYFARGVSVGYRFRDVPNRVAKDRLEPARQRPGFSKTS